MTVSECCCDFLSVDHTQPGDYLKQHWKGIGKKKCPYVHEEGAVPENYIRLRRFMTLWGIVVELLRWAIANNRSADIRIKVDIVSVSSSCVQFSFVGEIITVVVNLDILYLASPLDWAFFHFVGG